MIQDFGRRGGEIIGFMNAPGQGLTHYCTTDFHQMMVEQLLSCAELTGAIKSKINTPAPHLRGEGRRAGAG
jgi:hypothetical protein